MKQAKPIIHGRDHAPGGADPIPGIGGGGGPLERARVWSTYATHAPFTTSTAAVFYPFNHGWASGGPNLAVQMGPIYGSGLGGVAPAVVRILNGGVYAISYRFVADGHSGSGWPGTLLAVELYDVAPDYWDGIHHVHNDDGFGSYGSLVTTILNSTDFVPTSVYAAVSTPAGAPTLTFGKTTGSMANFTGCYLEVTRLGDTDTTDWETWTSDTPPGAAVPPAAPATARAARRRTR